MDQRSLLVATLIVLVFLVAFAYALRREKYDTFATSARDRMSAARLQESDDGYLQGMDMNSA